MRIIRVLIGIAIDETGGIFVPGFIMDGALGVQSIVGQMGTLNSIRFQLGSIPDADDHHHGDTAPT